MIIVYIVPKKVFLKKKFKGLLGTNNKEKIKIK